MAANCIFLVVCFQKWRGLGEQRTGKKCGIQCPKVINNFLSLKKKETAGGIEGDFLASGEFSFFREHTELPIVEEVEASLWYIRGIGVEIDFEVLQVTGGGGGVPFRRGLFLLAAAAVHCVAE